MPKIPGPESIGEVRAGPTRIADTSREGRALVNIGRNIGAIANEMAQKRERAENAGFFANVASSSDKEFFDVFEDHKNTADTNQPGFTSSLEQKLKEASNRVIERSKKEGGFRPSADAQQRIEIQLANQRGNLLVRAAAFENNRRLEKINTEIDSTIQSFSDSAFDDPDSVGDKIGLADTILSESEGLLRPDLLTAKRAASKESIALSAAKGLVERDPEQALDVLSKSNDITNNIPEETKDKLINIANDALNEERRSSIQEASNEAFRLARNGEDVSAAALVQSSFNDIDLMVSTGLFSDEQAKKLKGEIQREVTEQSIRKGFDDLVDNEGFDKAFDKLEEISKRVPKGWTPDEWDKYIADQQADLNRKVSRLSFESKENKKQQELQLSIGRGELFMNPQMPADPSKGSQDRKDVNNFYDQISEGWRELPAQELIDNNVEFIQNTGIVPDAVVGRINATMRSGSPEQILLVADLITRLQEVPNSANVLRDIPDESRALAIQIGDATRSGIELDQAIEIARKNTFGVTAQQKEVLRLKTQGVAKQLPGFLSEQVDKEFDPGIFFGAGEIFPSEPSVPVDMQADFNVAFDGFMTFTDGNTDQAKKLAFDSLKKVWAVSEVGGPRRFQKYAPEAFYSIDGIDDQWMDDQFLQEMEEKGFPNAELGFDFNTGRSDAPSYPIMITNESGLIDIARDPETGGVLRWKPDFKETQEFRDIQGAPGEAVLNAKNRRKTKLERRANFLRRKVNFSVNQGLSPQEREGFFKTDEGKERARRAINNLLVIDKIDRVEAKQLLEAYDTGVSVEELPAVQFGVQ